MPYNDELFQKFAAEGAKEQPEGLFPTGTPAVQQPQQEDAYSRMVREQYGQQQQAQQGKKNESSLLDNGLTRGFAGGLISVPASLADFGSGMLGTDGQVGTYLHNKANEYGGREKEYSWEEMKENPIDYLTDTRSGALYGFGNALGSSAGLMAATALAAKALPGAAAVGAGAKALQIANKIPGLNLAATPAGKLMALRVLQTVPEAMSQGGSKWREETHDQYGNLKEDADFGDARTKMLWDAALNVPLLALSNTLEAGITNKLVKDAAGKGLGFKLWQGAKGGAINMAQQGGEEGYQTGIDEYVGGERTLGQILNPLTWTDEAKAAAAEGAIGGVGQSAMMTGGGMALNAAFGGDDTTGGNTPPPPIPSPAEQGATLNNAVTLNEFPEAAGIAMNDHSGNPVDRMRNLQGTITHDASDGTNCMRTIGLALAGTPYGDLINVDDAINVAGNLGQLQDPANYVPRPGDLAVVNDGGHIVMVTENGGTIQNGQSANGVYESDLSPDQMFGGVKYYISASEFFGDNFTPVQRVMPAGGTAESQIAEQSFLEQGNEKPLFETGQQETQQETQEEQQQEPPRTYEPEYLETLRNSNMSDAELVETARGMQNLSDADPAKQIIIDKLRRRKINAGTGFTMEGNYPAIRNQRSEVTTPGTPKMEVRQEKTQNPPATPQGANDEVAQQFVNHYMGNPQSFMAHAQAQAQRIKQAYQTGAISQEQAVNNLQMLNDLVGRVMPAIQDDGTIRQGQREKGFTFGGSEGQQGTTRQTAQQPRQQYQAANIKPKDMPRLLNVARSAMAGDPEAVKRFMNYKPEVQQTLRDIVTGVLPVNEALRNRQEVPELPAGRSVENDQTQLQKPETGENRNQNKHAESGQAEPETDTNRKAPEKQSEDVKEKTPEEIEAEAAAEVEKMAEEFEKPPVANPVSADEVPDTLLEESAAKEKIEDFGQKIGGARKDTATKRGSTGGKSGGNTGKTNADFMKHVWFRNYEVVIDDKGKWDVRDKNHRWWKLNSQGYATEEEAKTALFKYVMGKKHHIAETARNSGEFAIERWIGSGSDAHWFALKKGFKSREAAKEYYDKHLEEIFKINTTFGEGDIPSPLIKSWQEARTGNAPQRLKKGEDATAQMFSDTFGFRGVQFGKWENQKERRSVMNATYEGLLDLAEALGISPKELSLGGELGIAFGARGRGGNAKAHYELAYTVINLTKMKGAGSLAHEWMHAVDHYLSMKAGTFSNNRDSDGKLTDRAAVEVSNMASNRVGALYQYFNKDRTKHATFGNIAKAYHELVDSLKSKSTSYTDNAETVKNTIEATTRSIAGYIDYLRSHIKIDAKNISQEDLQRLDRIYERLLAADEKLAFDYDYNYEMTPALKALNDIHKKITGKYLLKGRSVEYPFWSIRNAIKKIQNQRQLYKDAISQKQKSRPEQTDFYKNSLAIDGGRTTPYWANTEEMMARAFTTMVEDTLAEKGYASNFLAFGDNDTSGFGKPFPEGEERKNINQAFKKFFEAYKNDLEGIITEPEQITEPAQETKPAVTEETLNKSMEDLQSKMQDVINEILVKYGIGNPDTSQRETETQTTPAEVEETEQEPETNSEETVTSENEAGNEPENAVESEQEAEAEEGEENHVDNEEGLSGVPEGETSEGLSGNEEGRDAGSVRDGTDRESEGVLRGSEVPVSGQSSESEHGVRGQSEKPNGSGSVREGNDKRNDVRTGVNENEEKPLTPAQEKDAKASETPGHNFTITEEKEAAIGEGGKKTKYKNNVVAIRLLKQLEAENRQATPAEQETLAKYVGWGGIPEAFSRYDKDWQNEFKELEGLLTQEEYAAARASTKNAHFTSIGIVKDMWKIVERLGFKGGRVLEPSMGVGNFFGAMPENLRSRSSLNGVELDSITGRIAKQLYQKANIVISGFENKDNVKFPNNYFDLAISNVPFGDYKIHDKDYKNQYNIHNYFFAKSLDKVRPGGLICFITSTGTMDSGSDSKQVRRLLADKADLVGAIRLPNTSFKGNAGTQVTTDLIILQKRKEGAAPAAFNSDWLDTGDSELTSTKYQDYGKPLKINKYYLDHPNMLIGTLAEDTLYGGGRLALDGKGVDVLKELDKRIDSLPEKIYEPVKHTRNTDSQKTANTFLAAAGTRDNSYQLNEDGKVYQNDSGTMVELPKAAQPKAKAYVELRNVASQILQKQINPETSEEELKKLRKELNKKYDSFVKKFGYVNSDKNRRALSLDPEYGVISALEDYTVDKTTKKESAKKSAIFTKRTVNPINAATSADNPSDALALSLSEKGEVDIDYIGKLLGETPENAAAKLGDMVYDDPVSQNYVTAEEYLSGNVREKLEAAQFAAKNDPRYKRNVEALKKVQPVDLSAEEISVNLGTPWIPDTDISKFANEMLDENYNPVMKVTFSPLIGQWTVDWIKGNWRLNSVKSGMENTVKWGIPQHPFHKVLEDALNQKSPVITTTLGDGKTKVVDQKATAAAQEKVRQVQAEFKKWIWKDKERKERLVNYYNRNFNNTRLREYDGSHLTLPGYSAVAPQLNKHQKDAIWRIMQRGNTLLAHCVGAGKTWTMQTAAMEMKRLGIANKSMFVIPNHMVAQFEKEFRQIYGSAKLLVIDSENLPDVTIPKKKNATPEEEKAAKAAKIAQRQKILSSIATEDWDGIIISHNTFKRIPLSAKTTQEFYQKQINELVDAIEASKENGGKGNRAVKDLEKAKARLEAKLKDLANEEEKDVVIPFEQLGVDQIFVDEADLFKNLYFVTKMSRVAGLSNTASQRSMDMYMKTQYLTRVNNGRGVCFATGTPISNTMAEMFTMMRYLDSDGLMEKGISTFDNWAANFAVHEPTVERSPDGNGYRQVEKFTSFTNMPELIRMFRKFADVKRPEDLNLEVPKLKNGKTTTIEIKPSKALTNYIKGEIKDRSKAIHDKLVDPSEDNMLKLTGDLRKASLDMRLVDPTIPAAQAGGKLRAVADTIFKKYKETTKVKGAQLVFCDLSAPKGASDKVTETDAETGNADEFATEENTNVTAYEEIKKMLVAKGMPAKEIAFIHDAKNKKQKEALFEKVRNGDVRVLLGSTEKMGAGTNCQDHLVALHHIDAPWRPRDIEQRNGRILRRGNQNKEVEIFNYVTKDSFDANMWEKLKNKANMIGQAMSNNLTTRTIEDMDANVLSFAEVEALASGNPLMAEKTMVDADVTKYNMLLASYLKTHAAVKENFEIRNPAKIKNAEQRLADAKADVPLQAKIAGDNFKIEIGGKSYTKRADADKALKKIVEGYNNELGGIIGKVGGLKIRLRAEKAYSAEKNQYFTQVHCYVEGAGKYECDPTLGSIEYAATHKPEQQAGAMQAVLDNLKKEQKALAEEVKKPFEHQAKLDQLLKRQEEINKELHIGEENAQQGEDTDTNDSDLDNAKYQIAYHGTPHVFDTFSVEHVGSGEGAQLHGWGLYFSQDKSIAQGYRKHLAETAVTINGNKFKRDSQKWYLDNGSKESISYDLTSPEGRALDIFMYTNGNTGMAIDLINKFYGGNKEYIAFLKNNDLQKYENSGSLFEVDVPENDVLLDEQKPLKEQPEKVRAALKEILGETASLENVTGEELYETLIQKEGSPKAASQKLNEHGIKGITYKGDVDGRCFVVFDDKAIQVMQRYEAALRVHGEEINRSVDAIVAEVKDAYPGAKDVKVNGNNISFTMPNGVKLTANIKDQIIISGKDEAKARREHGLTDPNKRIVVEGYTRKLDNESLVVLSQESSKGTAYHEAFHTVWDWVLNDKEKADMTRYYSDKAKKTGANAEELMADGYKEWKLARAKGSGTLFGKLYKKMSDFIDTAKAIFTGMYKVHKIYEKIESGDVWNRDARGRFTGNNNENYTKFQAAMSKQNAPKTIEKFDKAIREADKPSKIGFWFTTSKGAEITIPGSNYKHVQDGEHPLTIKQWKAVTENLENADYAVKDNVVGPNGGTPVQIKIDTPLGKAGVSLEVLHNGRILVDTVVFNNDAAIDNWIKNKKSSQTLGIEPNGKQDRILGSLSLFDIIRDKLGIVNKFENTASETPKYSVRTGDGNDKTATGKVAQAMRNTERLTTVESGKEWIKEKWKNFYVDWIDKNDRMHDFDAAVSQGIGRELTADERVYDRVQTLSASASGMATGLIEGDARNIKAINEHLKHKQLKHNVTLNMIMKKISKEVMDKAAPDYLKKHGLSNWVNAFGNYLGARRLLEMEKVSHEAYKEQLAQWNKDKADGKKVGKQPVWKGYKFPQGLDHDTLAAMIREAPRQFAEAADMYYKFNDNVLTILEDAGLISEATHDLLATKYKNYCPLMRDFTDTAAADNFIGGLTNGGRGIANVSNMLKHISMEGSGRAIINPLESTVKAVSVACNRAERNKVGQMAVNMAMKNNLTRLIKSVPGGAPDAKNCIFTVMYNGKKFAFQTTQELYSPIVGYNLPAAGFVMGSLRAAARALRTGATTSPSFIVRNLIRDTIFAAISSKHGFRPFVDTIRGINAIWNNPELKAEFETAGVTAFNFYGSAEEITKSLDEMNGGKLQIHKPADILKALMRGFSFASELVESGTRMGEFMRAREQGESIEAAARAARELTLDFSRSGVTGERVNQMVPFFNACLQGGDKMVRLFREDPAGTFVKVAKYIILPSMFLWAMNHDEPWYKELDPNIKNTCWILPGDIRIPKPQEAGVFFGSGVEALLDKMYNTDPDAGKNWAAAFKDAMMPNIIPTLFLPLQEWQANYSYYRGKALVGKGLERLPDEMQYYQGTSEASKAIGSVFKVSPVKVDNLVRGYTGTMGMFVWQNLMDWTSDEKNNRPAKKLSEMPFIRDFNVTEANLHRTTDEFYDMAQNAQKWQNAYGKKGSPPAAISAINKANTFISKKQKEIRQISASRNISPERKRELITVRRLQIKRVAEQALNRYRDKY